MSAVSGIVSRNLIAAMKPYAIRKIIKGKLTNICRHRNARPGASNEAEQTKFGDQSYYRMRIQWRPSGAGFELNFIYIAFVSKPGPSSVMIRTVCEDFDRVQFRASADHYSMRCCRDILALLLSHPCLKANFDWKKQR
jgi:hypothetical protein